MRELLRVQDEEAAIRDRMALLRNVVRAIEVCYPADMQAVERALAEVYRQQDKLADELREVIHRAARLRARRPLSPAD